MTEAFFARYQTSQPHVSLTRQSVLNRRDSLINMSQKISCDQTVRLITTSESMRYEQLIHVEHNSSSALSFHKKAVSQVRQVSSPAQSQQTFNQIKYAATGEVMGKRNELAEHRNQIQQATSQSSEHQLNIPAPPTPQFRKNGAEVFKQVIENKTVNSHKTEKRVDMSGMTVNLPEVQNSQDFVGELEQLLNGI